MRGVMLVVLCFLSACTSVKSISFTSLTRGSRKEILVTPKEVKLTEQRMGGNEKVTRHLLAKEDWKKLVESLDNVELSEIDSLKSPTRRRLYDGAMASTLVIKTTSGEKYQHGFDDIDPHEKLKPLMDSLLTIVP